MVTANHTSWPENNARASAEVALTFRFKQSWRWYELVESADGGPAEPSQLKIGLVVGEKLGREELERLYGGEQKSQPIEFEEIEEDGSVKHVTVL